MENHRAVSSTVEEIILDCMNYYDYDNAIFLAECYFTEIKSAESLHLLATAYYRARKPSSAYSIIQAQGARTWKTKYLLARCCIDLKRSKEAEDILREFVAASGNETDPEFNCILPFVNSLLADMYSETNRSELASDSWKKSLEQNPFLWSSFRKLCRTGDKTISRSISDTFCPARAPLRHKLVSNDAKPPVKLPVEQASLAASAVKTPILSAVSLRRSESPCLAVLEDSPVVEAASSASSATISIGLLDAEDTPSPFTSPLDAENPIRTSYVPAAPRKVSGRTRGVHGTGVRATRQSSGSPHVSVLSQNQQQPHVQTRRSTRLSHSNSVKENSVGKALRSSAKGSGLRRTSQKKLSENFVERHNELNAATAASADQAVTARAGATAPLILQPSIADSKECMERLATAHSASLASSFAKETKTPTDGMPCELLLGILRRLADIEAAMGAYDNETAIQLIHRLPDNQSRSPIALSSLARSYFEATQHQKSADTYEECHRLFPHYLEGMDIYSSALWFLEKEMELSSLAQDLLLMDRQAPQTWCVVGNCFSIQKDRDTAIKFLQRAIQLNGRYAYAHTLLGHEYSENADYHKATQCYRTAIRLDPRHYNAWYGLGSLNYKQESLVSAKYYFWKALEINPRSSILLSNCSMVEQALGRSDEALRLVEEAHKFSPRDPLCRYYKAQILFARNRLQEALAELDEVRLLAPKEAKVFFLLGKIHKKLGNTHLALMHFSWGTELDPRGEQSADVLGAKYDDEPVSALSCIDANAPHHAATPAADRSIHAAPPQATPVSVTTPDLVTEWPASQ